MAQASRRRHYRDSDSSSGSSHLLEAYPSHRQDHERQRRYNNDYVDVDVGQRNRYRHRHWHQEGQSRDYRHLEGQHRYHRRYENHHYRHHHHRSHSRDHRSPEGYRRYSRQRRQEGHRSRHRHQERQQHRHRSQESQERHHRDRRDHHDHHHQHADLDRDHRRDHRDLDLEGPDQPRNEIHQDQEIQQQLHQSPERREPDVMEILVIEDIPVPSPPRQPEIPDFELLDPEFELNDNFLENYIPGDLDYMTLLIMPCTLNQ